MKARALWGKGMAFICCVWCLSTCVSALEVCPLPWDQESMSSPLRLELQAAMNHLVGAVGIWIF